MVGAAAGEDGPLVQEAQAGGGLAGLEDAAGEGGMVSFVRVRVGGWLIAGSVQGAGWCADEA